jgi:hypothetical protein
MKKESILAKGFFCENPREGAPDYVLAKISIKVPDAIAFLNEHANASGYVNLDLLDGLKGKPYLKLNDWKPSGTARREETAPEVSGYPDPAEDELQDINPEDIPF